MKTLLSIVLGLMLFTSLVGFSYAAPIVQPMQNTEGDNCTQQNQNNMMYNVTVACHGDSHVGGSADPPQHTCSVGRNAPDVPCCVSSVSPHSPEASDPQPVTFCGPP